MRDFSNLITALRIVEDLFNQRDAVGTATLYRDAADAIEELLDELTTIRKQFPRLISVEELLAELVTIRNQLPTWISVEDELPENGERVLIMFKPFEDDENISIGWLTKSGFDCYDDSVYFFRSVTHWMPLPEPPKGVE